jgi:hypothetical protein
MVCAMATSQAVLKTLVCDGCGLDCSSQHIAARLARLEQATRYRPIHIQAVFLSAQTPANAEAFLYNAEQGWQGEAAALLGALEIESGGKPAQAVLAEFQRKGFFLTHILECAANPERPGTSLVEALKNRLPGVLRRFRTSLKPKKVVVISQELKPVLAELKSAQIGAELILDGDMPFDLADPGSVMRLRSKF